MDKWYRTKRFGVFHFGWGRWDNWFELSFNGSNFILIIWQAGLIWDFPRRPHGGKKA